MNKKTIINIATIFFTLYVTLHTIISLEEIYQHKTCVKTSFKLHFIEQNNDT